MKGVIFFYIVLYLLGRKFWVPLQGVEIETGSKIVTIMIANMPKLKHWVLGTRAMHQLGK